MASDPRCPRNDACYRALHPLSRDEQPPDNWCDYAKAGEVELCPVKKGESNAKP